MLLIAVHRHRILFMTSHVVMESSAMGEGRRWLLLPHDKLDLEKFSISLSSYPTFTLPSHSCLLAQSSSFLLRSLSSFTKTLFLLYLWRWVIHSRTLFVMQTDHFLFDAYWQIPSVLLKIFQHHFLHLLHASLAFNTGEAILWMFDLLTLQNGWTFCHQGCHCAQAWSTEFLWNCCCSPAA